MPDNLMLLPARDPDKIRLVRIPEDFEAHEAFRHVTGLIAQVEENDPEYAWEDIAEILADHGFEVVGFLLGPELD